MQFSFFLPAADLELTVLTFYFPLLVLVEGECGPLCRTIIPVVAPGEGIRKGSVTVGEFVIR